MSNRNTTIESVTAIEKMLADAYQAVDLSKPEDRAEVAWWIHQTFVMTDFHQSVVRRDTKQSAKTIRGVEPTKK